MNTLIKSNKKMEPANRNYNENGDQVLAETVSHYLRLFPFEPHLHRESQLKVACALSTWEFSGCLLHLQ